ncbi:hypothetical protein ACHQM5_010552 [Ranunculus cassubicifolius]
MEEETHSHRELQLIPTHISRNNNTYLSSSSSKPESFDAPSLNLQLSISLQPVHGYGERKNRIETLKWQASEQFRLASIEKAYAEQVRELTRREMELAHSEFARARHVWEKAQEEVQKTERMKARATRRTDAACLEITCQACRRKFKP